MRNQEVAAIFAAMADMLAIQGENYHRILAYRLSAYEQLQDQVPAGVVDMLQVPDVGPKRVALFWKELGLTSVDALERAAREGRLRALPGMGAKSEAKVLAGVEALKRRTGRTLLGVAWPLAAAMLDALREVPGVVQVAPAGSLRRMRETVGDLDLLVASADAEPVMARFRELDGVAEVLLSGPTKTSIRTHDGLQVDLRVLDLARWGTALQYFTGSQAHNIRLRGLALDRGFSLSEYSLKREDDTELLCTTEEDVYQALGLPFIPPPLREDRGEIEAALAGNLPDLVALQDLKGDLQFHTTWSDGNHSLLDMAQAARARGLEYALVTDHSHSLGVAGGLTAEDLRRQRAEIEQVNRQLGPSFRLLAGVEVEVRADGSLDFPDEVLAGLDLVVASVHTGLRQDRERVTSRTLAAIRNPHVDIIAHPTGRLIGGREGADLDMESIFRAAAEMGTALEVNALPDRLDLRDAHVRRAIELGVKLAINSDAHHVSGFDVLPFGVATAQRGWATPADVINTRSVDQILAWAASRVT
jgi:DNA polymerase (family 10)